MKKYILIAVIAIGVCLFAGREQIAKAYPLYYIPESNTSTTLASSTAVYMLGGTSTTTKTIGSDGFEQVSWLVAVGASTTPPTICWTNQYSNNGTDWYSQDYFPASTTIPILHASTQYQECFLYASTTASTFLSRGRDGLTHFLGRKIVVPNLDTQFTRTQFSILAGGAAYLDIRSSLKNPVVKDK